MIKMLACILLFNSCVLFAQVKQSGMVSDSVAVEVSDSTDVAESDTTEAEEADLPWTLTALTEYDNTRMKQGIDLSGSNPTWNSSLTLLHENGLNGQLAWSSMLGSGGGPLNWFVGAGYDYSITDWLELNTGVSHSKYLTDSINAIFDLENSVSVGLTANLTIVDLKVGYDYYFGTDPAKYWFAVLSHTFEYGGLSVDCSASVTYMSQTIEAAKLAALAVKLKKKQVDTTSSKSKITLRGISSYSLDVTITYNLGAGFKVYFDPSYIVTPKGEIASRDKQLAWTVGVRYLKEF